MAEETDVINAVNPESAPAEQQIAQLFQASSNVYRALYQHLPVYSNDGKPTDVIVHRCIICKRVAVGAGVIHRKDCPARGLGKIIGRMRHGKGAEGSDTVQESGGVA